MERTPLPARRRRADSGIARPWRCKGSGTEAAFIEQRRADVDREVSAAAGAAQIETCPETWTERHEKEATFQVQKEHKRMVQALLDGSVSLDSVDPSLAPVLIECMRKEALLTKKYMSEQARRRVARAAPVAALGKAAFLESPVPENHSAAFRIALRRRGMFLAKKRTDAE
eukprot:8420018-Alexandrium_andersonii.AAC.1